MSIDDRITAIAASIGRISSQEALGNPSTAQARALKWIQGHDNTHLCPSDPKLVQRYILAVLFFETTGEKWALCPIGNEDCNFLDSADECSWRAISCNAEGYVTEIHLDSSNLSGSIPQEMGSLTYLEELDMDDNQLIGTLPPTLGSLSFLQYVDLDKNMLTGRLPVELFNATSLRVLDLDTNSFSGSIPSAVAMLPDLYFLQLDFNHLTGSVPSELASLKDLQYLSVLGNDFVGLLPSSLCGRDIKLYANCTLCPTDSCCTACLDG